MATTKTTGSAQRWGPLWGARSEDWARNEELQVPTYEEAIRRAGLQNGDRVLDIGCGSGVFLSLVAQRGGEAFGLDASQALIDVARARVPEAELQVGEMEALPYEADRFDLVTGFNSFFFAADMVAALGEAARVAKPGGKVVIQVWGPPERNDLEAMKEVARPFMPAPRADAPQPPPLWQSGVLEGMAIEADLSPQAVFDLSYAFDYPDEETLGRLMLAPAGIAELVGPEHEQQVRQEIVEALSPNRQSDGSYRLENEFHYLVATA